MRWNDFNDGSIKALLILILLAANIVVALSRHRASTSASAPGGRTATAVVERVSR